MEGVDGDGLSGLRGEGGRGGDTKASGYGMETKMSSAQAMESEQDFSTIRKYEAGLQTESMEWSERRSAVSQCMNCLGAISEELVWEGNLEGEGCSPFIALIYIYTCLHSYSALYGILIWYRYIVTLALSLLLTLSFWSANPNISRSRLFPRSIASFEKSTLWICPGVSTCSRR